MLLQLLTQRGAIEKKPQNKNEPLCRVLEKEGVLSDPERLMEKAQQVRSVFRDLMVLLSTTLNVWIRIDSNHFMVIREVTAFELFNAWGAFM